MTEFVEMTNETVARDVHAQEHNKAAAAIVALEAGGGGGGGSEVLAGDPADTTSRKTYQPGMDVLTGSPYMLLAQLVAGLENGESVILEGYDPSWSGKYHGLVHRPEGLVVGVDTSPLEDPTVTGGNGFSGIVARHDTVEVWCDGKRMAKFAEAEVTFYDHLGADPAIVFDAFAGMVTFPKVNLDPMPAPATGCRLYVDGSALPDGRVELRALFPTGDPQVLAAEPAAP